MNKHTFYFVFINNLKKAILSIVVTSLLVCTFSQKTFAQNIQIDNVNIQSAAVGITISVMGENFTKESNVYFGNIKATTAFINSNQLEAIVPLGATYDKISVITPKESNVKSHFCFTVKTPSPCSFVKPVFDTAFVFPTKIKPYNIALADLNKNGLKELLILGSNKTNATLTFFNNNSNSSLISFSRTSVTINLLEGGIPSNVEIADINNDGNMDAIVGYSNGNQLSILRGLSTGGFSTAITTINVPSSPEYVKAGDLNNDGMLEIVVSSKTNNTITILKYNIKNLRYEPINKFDISGTCTALEILDFDGDSFNDIILANDNQAFYYKNNKNSELEFEGASALSSTNTSKIITGNFEPDKKNIEDIIYNQTGGIAGARYENNLATVFDTNFPTNPISLTALDFNYDGIPDVAALVPNSDNLNCISFYQNNNSGGFDALKDYIATDIKGNFNLLTADIDGDKQADLITYNSSGEIYFYRKSSDVYITKTQAASVCPNSPATISAEANTGILSWEIEGKPFGTGSSITIPANLINSKPLTVLVKSIAPKCTSSVVPVTININSIPTITPTSLLPVKVGQTFKQDFTVLNGTNTTYTITPNSPSTTLPSWFNFSGNTLQWPSGINNAGTYYFTITAKDPLKCDAVKNYKLIIEDLLDPKLTVNPIYINVGDNAFLIKPSSTQSDGDIEYTLKTGASSSCAVIEPKGWVSKITCADSIPVMVTQFASGRHKQSQVEIFIKISPNPATLLTLTTTGVSINDTDAKLKYRTNSDALQSTIEIIQLSNTDVAQIDPYGNIKPYKQGTVDIEIRVPPTSTYAAITRTYTITVYPNIQKPIIVNDTIRITVDQDTIVNILENDIGVTRAIAPSKTDIDMENDSLQNKYFSLSVGNFLIDANGNLDVKPFSGFIGEGKINYTVTDSAGIKSNVGYVVIQVAPLVVNPPLKANEVMTPNNDGLNDGLLIGYANLKSTSSLTIMDGVGNVVYETTNYQNDWRGINKKGDALEPGVYFYVYEEKESGRSLKQYIQIIK